MPKSPTQLAHVVYRTRRFDEMIEWYEKVFDSKTVFKNPGLAFLTFGEEHHRFAFANLEAIRPDETDKDDRGMVGVDHVAWEYDSLRDLMENYAELKAAGIKPYWAVNHGMSASLYYADPDGNQMEFSVDCFPTKAEASAYFKGPEINDNPVGVEFDADEWLKKIRAGAPDSELLKIDHSGPVSPIRGALTA